MNKLSKLFDLLIHNPNKLLYAVVVRLAPIIPDKLYLKWLFRLKMGYKLNLDNPSTFSEKLQWLKLYNRKPEYTQMVDKLAVKEYVSSLIGEEYIIPTLGVWERTEDIEWDKLPDKFVLKTTHGAASYGVAICRDKSSFNREDAIKKLDRSMKTDDIYTYLKEWPYKNVHRRIIAEEYLVNDNGSELKDYKFFCFHGSVRFFKIDSGRFTEHHANYYDRDGHSLPFGEVGIEPNFNNQERFPDNLSEMITIAETLSAGKPFLRVDLYNIMGRINFGETTFYPASGLVPFTLLEWDYKMGDYLSIDSLRQLITSRK